jgi:hypothetical protein
MALWGNRDSFSITGTSVSVVNGSPTVTSNGATDTTFLTDFQEGDTIVITGVKYKIFKINSATVLTLVVNFAGSTATVLNTNLKGADIPKYILQQDLQYVFFLDQVEAQQEENIVKGLNEPGWWFYKTYTDAQGQVRNKAEHLVAFSVLPAVSSDAADDATVVDGTITITSQGSNRTIAAGLPTTFVVAATLVGGTTLSYKWQTATDAFPTYADLSNSGVFSDVTLATLSISDVTGYDGYRFRCVISSDGCTSKTSTPKTLTVTA